MHNCIPCKIIKPKSQQASYDAAISANPANAVASDISTRAIYNHRKSWKHLHTLTVAFVDTPPYNVKQSIKNVIMEWQEEINLTIKFVDGADADIRIKTDTDIITSAIGTDALTIEKDQPTLYISSKPEDDDFQFSVLHAFGHALGLEDEHLHYEANIPWNKQAVYDYCAELTTLTKEEIDEIFFSTVDENSTTVTDYDKDSVMHFPVNKNLTDGKFEIPPTNKLSYKDRYCALSAYTLGACSGNDGRI